MKVIVVKSKGVGCFSIKPLVGVETVDGGYLIFSLHVAHTTD